MATNTRTIARNSLFLYCRFAITLLIGFVTVRIVLKELGPVDFGVYNVVSGFVAMMAFINNALSSTTQRFLSYEIGRGDSNNLKSIFKTNIALYVYLCVIIVILGESFGIWFINNKLDIPSERILAANWIYQFSIIALVFSVLQSPFNAAIIAHEEMNVYAWVSIAEAVLKIALVLSLRLLGGDKLILYGLFISIVSATVFLLYYSYSKHRFSECVFSLHIEKQHFKVIASYAGWNIFGAFSNIISGQGINVLLNIFFGVLVNTARGIAYQIDSAINGFVQNFYTAVRPQLIQSVAENNEQSVFFLVLLSTKIGYFLMSILGVFFAIEMPTILRVWLGEYSTLMVAFSRIILLAFMFGVLVIPLNTVINGTGYVKAFNLTNGLLTILNLPISYFLLLFFKDEIIPFLVLVAINIFRWINAIIQTKKVFRFDHLRYLFLCFKLLSSSIIVCVLGVIVHLLVKSVVVRFLSVFAVVICSYSLLAWFFILDSSDRDKIQLYVIELIKR